MRIIDGVINMLRIFDENATKKPTNLSVNSDLLSKARSQKINLSAILEHALECELRKTERENWLKDNKCAIDSLNKLVEKNGLFSDKYRKF
jgi:antitoxin CcdA